MKEKGVYKAEIGFENKSVPTIESSIKLQLFRRIISRCSTKPNDAK